MSSSSSSVETFEDIYSRVSEQSNYEVIRYNLLRFVRYEHTRRMMRVIIREFMNLDTLYRLDLVNFYNYLLNNIENINNNMNDINVINNANNDRLMIDQLINQSRCYQNLFQILDMICEQCGKML